MFDAVYTPRNTRLLKEAAEVGAITVSGVEMFIRQAIGQFRLFTGCPGNIIFIYLFGSRNLQLEASHYNFGHFFFFFFAAPEDYIRKLVKSNFESNELAII